MYLLAIETSCDETAAAVLKIAQWKNRVRFLSNMIASQATLHAKTGGVVPEVAARAHVEKIIPVIRLALKRAKISIGKLAAIAVTAGPGLAPALAVGVDTARTLAWSFDLPLFPINHLEAHVFSAFIKEKNFSLPQKKRVFPAVALVVSGGHTDLVYARDWLKYKKIGQTLDDAAGECFDKIARLLNLSYPGGPALSKLAKQGSATINFPRPMLKTDNFDFSFSGLKTAVLYYLRNHKLPTTNYTLSANIAASVETAIVDVLVHKTIQAAIKLKAKTVLLGGGVAANLPLRARLKEAANKNNLNLLITKPEYCTDNAGMIGFCGWLHWRKQNFTPLKKIVVRAGWELT
ncbi:MAG: tRNA (adenosine(37)-N6)-threonylcarbamoyltransferase complex transferase subunit TsaD [Candidatus Doudnabacteria bacterium]|nr:tRNA (adenosine(37)-N6)-threonylcarbamoyltransferase complex transferase subunit TsaD [Candidatus Doudnabacteria bacterium]